ncbi:2-keto-3-deoxy-D-arabino-heptulosonate-7-phosphate synthase I alpha [hydrothermal vent metagenome]|uniref:3-deoxy-7-phosphoheptulonate synthase n=1 Tax=hydrothermal vent metagenome TaxID=652676 RepID=A0A3B1E5A8_9ZZZZ
MQPTQNINVESTTPLTSPHDLKQKLSASETANFTVYHAREKVKRILAGEDQQLIVVVGPCSIHDREAAMEYARKLKQLADDVAENMLLIMRVYFEKPRTSIGWKGLINDPHLNDTLDVSAGLEMARSILIEINAAGVPAATEMLEPITPQYIADLITIASIGARTTESPTHRQMASGLSMPVGYKNGTDGSLDVALNAMTAAQAPHSFVGIDAQGKTCIVNTKGNPWGHLILRGGRSGPNYDAESVANATNQLLAKKLSPRFFVDCSHANSNKDHTQQSLVWNNVITQRVNGNKAIIGAMLESNLLPGNQKLGDDPGSLQRGVSITDSCIGWEETEQLIRSTHQQLANC